MMYHYPKIHCGFQLYKRFLTGGNRIGLKNFEEFNAHRPCKCGCGYSYTDGTCVDPVRLETSGRWCWIHIWESNFTYRLSRLTYRDRKFARSIKCADLSILLFYAGRSQIRNIELYLPRGHICGDNLQVVKLLIHYNMMSDFGYLQNFCRLTKNDGRPQFWARLERWIYINFVYNTTGNKWISIPIPNKKFARWALENNCGYLILKKACVESNLAIVKYMLRHMSVTKAQIIDCIKVSVDPVRDYLLDRYIIV